MYNYMEDVNVLEKIIEIKNNIPENIETLEKIRWVYMMLGQVFSYDFRITANPEIAKQTVDFSKNYISKYQTCVQISEILNRILNTIPGCKSEIIDRKIEIRGHDGKNHKANAVTLETGEKYLLDLTLDLYLIQSGCQTKEFGYTTDKYSTYDIISRFECKNIDKKLGFNINYLDSELEKLDNAIAGKTMNEKIKYINEFLKNIHFAGYHEKKTFVDKLIFLILKVNYKEYNLKHIKNGAIKLYTCFKLEDDTGEYFCMFNDDNKLEIVEKNVINDMINNGWITKSETLLEELNKKVR